MFDFQRFQLIRRHGERGRLLAESRRRQVQLDADAGVPREEINRRYYRQYAGEPADALMLLGRLWFAAARAEPGFFVPGTLEALRQHRSAGAEIVLVSGSFPPCLAPIAQYLGAARVLCTDPEVREGRLTGEIGEPVIGEG